MSKRVPKSLKLATLLAAATAAAFADTINFENQCPSGQTASGPCSTLFSTVGNAQTLTIPTSIGSVTISGGALFDNIANLPVDETAVYGTAGNASGIGVFPGSGFANPLSITFPEAIASFSLDILNGNTASVTYQLADNLGNSADFQLAPNFAGGLQSYGFAAAGNEVTISALTGQSTPSGMTWDFLIDNINFTAAQNSSSSVPEPASAYLLGAGLIALWLVRRRNAKLGVFLALLCASLLPVPSASAATTAPMVALTCPSATGAVGVAYASSLGASGGVPPYTFSVGSGGLPGGLTLNASTGAITGTPLDPGTANFMAKAVDSLVPGAGGSPDSTSTPCSIVIAGAPVIDYLDPYFAGAGSNAFTLTVNGTGFTATSVATWNGTPLPTTFVSTTQVTVPVSAGLIMTPQYATVTVSNSGLLSNNATFSVEETWEQITDPHAVSFGQAPPGDSNLVFDWQTGLAFADYKELKKDGITGGFIQVLEFDSTNPELDGAWVVQNFPVEKAQATAGNSMPFIFANQLSGPINGTQMAVYHTNFVAAPPKPQPKPNPNPGGGGGGGQKPFVPPVNPAPARPQFYPTRPVPSTIGGMLIPPITNPPDPSTIQPIDPTLKRTDNVDSLTDENSIKQQTNECAPAAVANSMNYLNGIKNLGDGATNEPSKPIPVPGKATPPADPKSRVAWLDYDMGYTAVGTWTLGIKKGKEAYIAGKNAAGKKTNPAGKALDLTMDSQGRFCPSSFVDPSCATGENGTSGAVVKEPFITDALMAKKDVEVCFAWPAYPGSVGPPRTNPTPAGAHCVFVTGYRFVNGFLSLDCTQDFNQGKLGGVDFEDGGHVSLRIGIVNGELWIPSFFGRPAKITNVITEAPK